MYLYMHECFISMINVISLGPHAIVSQFGKHGPDVESSIRVVPFMLSK